MTTRAGRAAPAHYGSAAGELAVCMTAVGLAARSDLAVLAFTARRRSLDHLLTRVLGHGVAPNGVAVEGAAWWCRSAAGNEILVIHPYAQGPRLGDALRRNVHRFTGAKLTDLSESRFVLSVLGRRTRDVLADLGVKDASPFSSALLGGHRVDWLFARPTSAIGIVDAHEAAAVWKLVETAGRAHGISCVGLDSVERYALVGRSLRG